MSSVVGWRGLVPLLAVLIVSFPLLGLAFGPAPVEDGPEALAMHDAPLAATAALGPGAHRFEPNAGQAPDHVRFIGWGADGIVHLDDTGLVAHATDGTATRIGFGAEGVPHGAAPFRSVSDHYLGDDPSTWRTDVPHFAQVVYPALWPGIDLVVYFTPAGHLEFDHVLAPGADPDDVRLQTGPAQVQDDGSVLLGQARLLAPIAFDDDGDVVPVSFRLDGSGLGYTASSQARVIDPVLRFGTYEGVTGREQHNGVTIATHPSNTTLRRVLAVGEAASGSSTLPPGFPSAFAATQTDGTPLGKSAVLSVYEHDTVYNTTDAVRIIHIGGGGDDIAYDVAVDAAGKTVVVGGTTSSDFPTLSPVRGDTSTLPRDYDGSALTGGEDVFVARFTDAYVLDFATYLGGSGLDRPAAVDVDAAGKIALTGVSSLATSGGSDSYPLRNAYQATTTVYGNTIVTVLDPATSTLEFSTYIGDTYRDSGEDIAIDNDHVYVIGSHDTSPLIAGTGYPTTAGAFQTTNPATSNAGAAVVTRFDRATPTVLGYSTLITGKSFDRGMGLELMSDKSVWLAIMAGSADFPVCNNPITPPMGNPCSTNNMDATHNGGYDTVFAHLSADGSTLLFSTFYGGSDNEWLTGMAREPVRGHIIAVGQTTSADHPTENAFAAARSGPSDQYLVRFDPVAVAATSGTPAFFSTYLGSTSYDRAQAVASDDMGNLAVVGYTYDAGFPLSGATQSSHGGDVDASVLVIGQLPPEAKITATHGSDDETSTDEDPVPPSTLPRLKVDAGDAVTLDALASSKGDFPLDATKYRWTLYEADGITVVSSVTGGSSPSFSPLTVSGADSRVVCVEVRDDGPVDHPDGGDTACIAVEWENRLPVPADDAITVDEDSGATSIDVLANDVEPDGDTMRITGVTSIPSSSGSLTHTSGALSFTPAPDFYTLPGAPGSLTATYTVADSYGGSATATVTIDVRNLNDAPTATDDAYAVAPGTTTPLDVLANDADPDPGGAWGIVSTTAPAQGSVTITSGGTGLVYAADAGYVGAVSFTYTIEDADGASDTATVSIDIAPVDGVLARDDTASATEDGAAVAIDVLANDVGPAADPPAVLHAVSPPSGGTATIDADGLAITYVPGPDFFGPDTFTYDLVRGATTSTATVTVDVAATPDPPTAVDDVLGVQEDSADNVLPLLDNDRADPDAPEALEIVAVTAPAHGTVQLTGGVVRYTPDADFSGEDAFTYTIADPDGLQATAEARVDVAPLPDAPVTVADAYTVVAGAPDQFLGVLANDIDPDGDVLAVDDVSWSDAHGALAPTAGGFLVSPPMDLLGTVVFGYNVTDGLHGSAHADVTLDIVAPTDPVLFLRTATHPLCAGQPIEVQGVALWADHAPVTWTWSDGTVVASSHHVLEHAFVLEAGARTVALDVDMGEQVLSGTLALEVVTCVPPVADFDFRLSGERVRLIDRSQDDGTIVSWTWDVAGEERHGPDVTHDLDGPGNHVVRLTVVDDMGNTASITKGIAVGTRGTAAAAPAAPADSTPPPAAPPAEADMPPVAVARGPATVLPGETVRLDGTASHDGDDPLAHRWTQIDGPAVVLVDARSPTASFTAPESGVLRFRLEVEGGGESDSDVLEVAVGAPAAPAPVPKASFDIVLGPQVRFVDTSGIEDAERTWSINGVTYQGPEVLATLAPGDHRVRLVVEADGERAVAVQTVHVAAPVQEDAATAPVPTPAPSHEVAQEAVLPTGGLVLLALAAAAAMAAGVLLVLLRRR